MMRAAVLPAVGERMRLESIPRPEPRAGEVLLRVAACGVCHTDLHVVRGEVGFPVPAVLGHEVSGIVEAVGDGVDLTPGTRVVSSFIMPCGTCRHCVRGHDDLCELFFSHNRQCGTLFDGTSRLARADGTPLAMYSMAGLAEYCVVPAQDVFVLPDGLDLVESAVLGCSAFTAFGAVRNVARVEYGETVAVVAAGGVGLNLIRLARQFGASQVIAVDVDDQKLELARAMGATDVVNSRVTDPVAAARDLTGGRGVDVAFEALGLPQTVETAIRSVDDGGRVVLVGIAAEAPTAALDITHVVRRKIRILGSYGARTRTDMPDLLALTARGGLDLGGLITRRVPLSEAGAVYDELASGRVVGRAVVDMGLE